MLISKKRHDDEIAAIQATVSELTTKLAKVTKERDDAIAIAKRRADEAAEADLNATATAVERDEYARRAKDAEAVRSQFEAAKADLAAQREAVRRDRASIQSERDKWEDERDALNLRVAGLEHAARRAIEDRDAVQAKVSEAALRAAEQAKKSEASLDREVEAHAQTRRQLTAAADAAKKGAEATRLHYEKQIAEYVRQFGPLSSTRS